VLIADSLLIVAICMGYGFAHRLGSERLAIALLYACMVGDQLLFGVNMARDTYLSKIARKPEDIAPSLSLGVTINHAVSMSVPSLGGLLWMGCGHTWVFVAAGGIAVLMLLTSTRVRTPAA